MDRESNVMEGKQVLVNKQHLRNIKPGMLIKILQELNLRQSLIKILHTFFHYMDCSCTLAHILINITFEATGVALI